MSRTEILEHVDECPARKLAERIKGATVVLGLLGLAALAGAVSYQRMATREIVRQELDARLPAVKMAQSAAGGVLVGQVQPDRP